MSPTLPLFASPSTAPQAQADCAHLPRDTFLRPIMTEVTTDLHHAIPLRTMAGPHPGMVHHAHLATSPRTRLFMVLLGPHTITAGVGLHLVTAWGETGPSTREITSMSVIMSHLLMSKASPMATLIHMVEILTRTHAHLGLPAMGPLHPHTHIHVGYLMATAHLHLPHIDGDHQVHPTNTTGLPMPEGPARAFMNLTVRQTRMTGASDHRV